jgi:REP element-mobilizing transposase RayT
MVIIQVQMNMRVRKVSSTKHVWWQGKHRFEHWYCDNCVYFITSKVREGFHAFASEEAKSVFWDRFSHYTFQFGFEVWAATLMVNHYHTIGYLKRGDDLGVMMQRIHGSVAKLVNDLLPVRHLAFWRTAGNKDYFDGCIRDEMQARRAYRYTITQPQRHGLLMGSQPYAHARQSVDLEQAIAFATQQRAFLSGVPYARYERKSRKG